MEKTVYSHAELLRLAASELPADRATVDHYLSAIARAFSTFEVLAVMTLVDTPDVLG